MIRKSTWEAYFKYPKAFSLPSNWQELGVFFFWFYVMLLWSLEQRGRYKRQMEEKKKKNLLHLSSSTSFAWKPLCGDLCDWAGCLPVTGQGKDGQGGPSASQSWFPPHPTLQLGTFSISSSGKAGNWLFLWDEHDPEKHSAQSACVLDRVLGAPSHQRGFEPLSTADMQVFQGNSNSSWAPNHHNSWPSCLHRQSEKFISTGSS